MIKDSGERRKFSTLAERDCAEGKGRFDIMPLDIVAGLLNDAVVDDISCYQQTGNIDYIYAALYEFKHTLNISMPELMLEVSKHYEEGNKKYPDIDGKPNWMYGIPENSYIDSAVRHYMKHLAGYEDEPHNLAFVWNMLGLAWTHKNITVPTMDIVEDVNEDDHLDFEVDFTEIDEMDEAFEADAVEMVKING